MRENWLTSVEAEVKGFAIKYFETFSDECGYVTEKRERIEALKPGDGWVAFNMLHICVRKSIIPKLTTDAKTYLIMNQMITHKDELW